MTIEQGTPGTGSDSPADEAPRVVRASSDAPRTAVTVGAAGQEHPAVITAELPIYRDSATGNSSLSQYAQPRPPGRSRRHDPAPVPIRIVVWLLGFVCLLSLVALITESVHPSWMAFMRNTSVTPAKARVAPKTRPPVKVGQLTVVSQTATSVTYDVPASGFTILLQPVTDAFATVTSPATSGHLIYEGTVTKASNGGPRGFVYVKQSAALVFQRASTVLEIQSGPTLLGTIDAPKTGITYIFVPKG